MTVRILIATPTRIYREALTELLEARPTFEVAGATSACTECLATAAAGRPDVVVADFALPDCLSMLRQLLASHAHIGAVVVGVPNDLEQVVACAEVGAAPVVREAAVQDLVNAVESGATGGMLCPPEATRALVQRLSRRRTAGEHAPLTSREAEIASLIARGCSNKVIAAKLCICVSTVKIHVSHILEKLGAASRVEVAALVADSSGRAVHYFGRGPFSAARDFDLLAAPESKTAGRPPLRLRN
jgi:two-component system nitrate/nitrite response regulator NarL